MFRFRGWIVARWTCDLCSPICERVSALPAYRELYQAISVVISGSCGPSPRVARSASSRYRSSPTIGNIFLRPIFKGLAALFRTTPPSLSEHRPGAAPPHSPEDQTYPQACEAAYRCSSSPLPPTIRRCFQRRQAYQDILDLDGLRRVIHYAFNGEPLVCRDGLSARCCG
jgi:hypothetical protein